MELKRNVRKWVENDKNTQIQVENIKNGRAHCTFGRANERAKMELHGQFKSSANKISKIRAVKLFASFNQFLAHQFGFRKTEYAPLDVNSYPIQIRY